jgi:hypothetical protein
MPEPERTPEPIEFAVFFKEHLNANRLDLSWFVKNSDKKSAPKGAQSLQRHAPYL